MLKGERAINEGLTPVGAVSTPAVTVAVESPLEDLDESERSR